MGQPIYGNYAITRELGRGGMGAVFVAENQLGKKKAIKLLLPELCTNESVVKRFFAEAHAAARIDHPNIISVEDLGRLPSGEFFLVMELLEGKPLDELIGQGPIALDDVLAIMVQVCAALAACHHHGIVHRDLKPANLFVVADNRHPRLFTKILDFGIAKLADENLSSHTQMGAVIGTPSYMAPEQARGFTDQIDHRTDIYALGVILYELVTGRPPFRGGSLGAIAVEQVQMQLPDPRQSRPDLPEHWLTTIRDALAYQREARPQSALDLAYRLIGTSERGWALARQHAREFADAAATANRPTLHKALDDARLIPLWPPQAASVQVPTAVLRPNAGQHTPLPISGNSAVTPSTTFTSSAGAIDGRPPRERQRRLLWLGAGVVVVAAAAIAVVMTVSRNDTSESQPAADQPSVAAAAPADAAGVAIDVSARTDASVVPAPAADVEIRVTTVPTGAEISVDGVVKGVSPLTVNVASTSTQAIIAATLAGHEQAEQRVAISPNTDSVAITLQPKKSAVSAAKEKQKQGGRPRSSEPSSKQTKPAANSPAYNPDDVGGD